MYGGQKDLANRGLLRFGEEIGRKSVNHGDGKGLLPRKWRLPCPSLPNNLPKHRKNFGTLAGNSLRIKMRAGFVCQLSDGVTSGSNVAPKGCGKRVDAP
jgi:hypothetical protein